MAEENTNLTPDEGLEENTPKTYTEEDVQKLLQAEADRRVSQALNKQRKQFETQIAEAEKLKNMDEAQRKEYEYEQKVKALEAKEREFTIAQNKLEATKILASREVPVEFVDYIVADDADTMLENINTFERLFKACVSDAVAKKIPSSNPKAGATKQTGLTKEEFRKLSIFQKQELAQSNPQLYQSLIN